MIIIGSTSETKRGKSTQARTIYNKIKEIMVRVLKAR
jgi:hypothetical protein